MSIQQKMRSTDQRTTAHYKHILHRNHLHIHYLQIFGREWKYFRPFTAIAEAKRGNSIKALILLFVDFSFFIHLFIHSLQYSLLLLFSFSIGSCLLMPLTLIFHFHLSRSIIRIYPKNIIQSVVQRHLFMIIFNAIPFRPCMFLCYVVLCERRSIQSFQSQKPFTRPA